jgi:hypothetical protein
MPEDNYIITVGELIKYLQSFPPDTDFWIYYEKRDQFYCPERSEITHTDSDDSPFYEPPKTGVILHIRD